LVNPLEQIFEVVESARTRPFGLSSRSAGQCAELALSSFIAVADQPGPEFAIDNPLAIH
jgi:hypothetical protein